MKHLNTDNLIVGNPCRQERAMKRDICYDIVLWLLEILVLMKFWNSCVKYVVYNDDCWKQENSLLLIPFTYLAVYFSSSLLLNAGRLLYFTTAICVDAIGCLVVTPLSRPSPFNPIYFYRNSFPMYNTRTHTHTSWLIQLINVWKVYLSRRLILRTLKWRGAI